MKNDTLFEPIRQFRRKLKHDGLCLGSSITMSDPVASEVLGRFSDFLWIDLEHSVLNLESLEAHLVAARAVHTAALVRVPGCEEWFIKRVLDAGAGGIIVPQVRSAAEVKRVVDACRYMPLGNRGYGPRRASNYGQDPQYLETVNDDVFVSVQIENVEALAEIEKIVQIPGLDSIALGPFDLAASMGHMRHPERPEVVAAIDRVIRAAKSNGLFVGMGGPADEAYAQRAIRQGVQWLQCGTDFEYMGQFFGPFIRHLAETCGKKITPPGGGVSAY
jgi:2-dehydro-3-deoxyglucarate aldolase